MSALFLLLLTKTPSVLKLLDWIAYLLVTVAQKVFSGGNKKRTLLDKSVIYKRLLERITVVYSVIDADSVSLDMFHNGGKDQLGVSFDKYSRVMEYAPTWKRFLSSNQGIPLSAYPDYFHILFKKDYYYNGDLSTGEYEDEVFRAVMVDQGVLGMYAMLLKTPSGRPLGVLSCLYDRPIDLDRTKRLAIKTYAAITENDIYSVRGIVLDKLLKSGKLLTMVSTPLLIGRFPEILDRI